MTSEVKQKQVEEFSDNDLLSQLIDSHRNDRVILIFTNPDATRNFSAGVVSEIFDYEVIINHYLANGNYDGFHVKKISNIYRIETHTKYAKKIEILRQLTNAIHERVDDVKEDGFSTMLHYALKHKKVVTIELCDSDNNDVIGFVKQINDPYITISMLDENGEFDGETVFLIEHITHIACDGDEEIVLKQLNHND